MNNDNSPFSIELLIWYHCRCEQHPKHDIPLVIEETKRFLVLGAIRFSEREDPPNLYETTPLGAAWVKAICRTPLPKTAFIDEQGNVLSANNDRSSKGSNISCGTTRWHPCFDGAWRNDNGEVMSDTEMRSRQAAAEIGWDRITSIRP